MGKKVISFEEEKRLRDIESISNVFSLDDIDRFANAIDYTINSFAKKALDDNTFGLTCMDVQLKIFNKITESYFKLLFEERDRFMEYGDNNRILYNFLAELSNICNNLPCVEDYENKKILEFKKEEK